MMETNASLPDEDDPESARHGLPGGMGQDFDAALFRALHAMAIKSPRFQADVQAAMRHANLSAHPARLAAALQRLEVAGQVSNLIPLSDGGLLITVAV
jgi:hypothetical protein